VRQTSQSAATSPQPKQTVGLVRGLGGWAAAAIVVGTMIGTGIFIVPAEMARDAGSAWLVTLVWIVGGALTLFGALAAAELGAALPEAGGTYAYLNRAYGPAWGFLFGWVYCVLGAPTSIAAIAAGLVRFVGFFFPFAATPVFSWHVSLPWMQAHTVTLIWAQLLAVVAIAAVTFINYLGVRLGGEVQVALTIVKIAAIVAVIAVAFFFGHGTVANFHSLSPAGAGVLGLSGFLTAMAGALWSYDGWVNLTFVGSEIRNPERNIPLALFGGVALVCGLYVAMSAACFFVLPFSKVAASSLVASDVVARATGHSLASWLTLAMIVCALGTLNSSILTNARVDYAMARDGLFFRVARGVNPRFHTPSRALVFQAILASVLALRGTFEDLLSLYVFIVWIFYALETAAVIRLRKKEPNLARPYHTWGYPVLPILFVIGALAFTVNRIMQFPLSSCLGLALMFFGFVFYRHWRARRFVETTDEHR
jgi:basic amino acid/polyamine antiporter, APA family